MNQPEDTSNRPVESGASASHASEAQRANAGDATDVETGNRVNAEDDFINDLESWRQDLAAERQTRGRSWRPFIAILGSLLVAAGVTAAYWYLTQPMEGFVLQEAGEGAELFRDGVLLPIQTPLKLQPGDRLVLQDQTAKLVAAGQDAIRIYPNTAIQLGKNKNHQTWLIVDAGSLRFTRPAGVAAVDVLMRTPQADITLQPFDAFVFASEAFTQVDMLSGASTIERRNNFSKQQLNGGESLRVSSDGFDEVELTFPLDRQNLLFRLGNYHSNVPETWATHSVAFRGTARVTGSSSYDVRDGAVVVADSVSETLAELWAAGGAISFCFTIRADEAAEGSILWLGDGGQPLLVLREAGGELRLQIATVAGEETILLGKNQTLEGNNASPPCWHVELADKVRVWNDARLIASQSLERKPIEGQLSPLILGRNGRGLEDWDGEIDSLAIWTGPLSQGQVERNLAVRALAVNGKKRNPPIRVAAVLREVSNVPAAVQQEAMVVSRWEVAEAADDSLSGSDILVLDWAWQDNQLQEAAQLAPGLSTTLLLEPLEANPQLGRITVYSDFEAKDPNQEADDADVPKLRRFVRVRGE